MGSLSYYSANGLLNLTLRGDTFDSPSAVYLGWFITPPAADDTGTEVSGGSYVRKAITFDPAASGDVVSDAAVTWTTLHTSEPQMLIGWGVWDASSAGNLLAFGRTPSMVIPAGGPLNVPAAAIVISSNDSHITDDLAGAWLDHLVGASAYTPPAEIWAGLYTSVPTAAGSDGTEVAGGGYGRQLTTWSVAALGESSLDSAISWAPLHAADDQDVAGIVLHDAESSGDPLMFAAYPNPVAISAGDTCGHASQTLSFRLT